MISLREQIEKDTVDTIEGEFRMTVELTSPDGEKQTMSKIIQPKSYAVIHAIVL